MHGQIGGRILRLEVGSREIAEHGVVAGAIGIVERQQRRACQKQGIKDKGLLRLFCLAAGRLLWSWRRLRSRSSWRCLRCGFVVGRRVDPFFLVGFVGAGFSPPPLFGL